MTIIWENYKSSIPIIREEKDIDKVKLFVESKIHEDETSASNTKLCIIWSVSFIVSRLVRLTRNIDEVSELFGKNKYIIIDNMDNFLCWYRFLTVCLNKESMKKPSQSPTEQKWQRKSYMKNIESLIQRSPQKKQIDNIKIFKGIMIDRMKESAKKNNININIYECIANNKDEDKKYIYNLQEQ